MDKKEYLQAVMEQIRFPKAKGMISDELENHIEDQKDAFVYSGMEEEEAYEKAVAQMGDPIEVGIAMDRIHRPRMEWKMIVLVLALSIMGVILQFVMKADMGRDVYKYPIGMQLLSVGAGIVIMIFFCYFDYTRIGQFSKAGAAIIIFLLLLSMSVGLEINGQKGYLSLGGLHISIHELSYLYVAFLGGILYDYRNQGNRGVLKAVLWIIIPVYLCFRLPNITLSSALLIIMLLQICYVMKKGWFQWSSEKIAIVACITLGYPIIMLSYYLFFGAAYQRERLLTIFSNSYEGSYQLGTARKLLLGSNVIGRSATEVGTILPDVPSDYIVTYVFSYYGILAAVLLLLALGYFIIKVFRISLRQKNQLGMAIGIGCSLIFTVRIAMYVSVNLTIMPTTQVFLPFFSCGGTGTIVSYALLGIMLSIYRYRNVMPVNPSFMQRRLFKTKTSN